MRSPTVARHAADCGALGLVWPTGRTGESAEASQHARAHVQVRVYIYMYMYLPVSVSVSVTCSRCLVECRGVEGYSR